MKSIESCVLEANKWIVDKGLIELTWGNVSFYDRTEGKVYIKPSGVNLSLATNDQVSCVDMSGNILSGLKPSVDTWTHLEIYRNFDNAKCVVHTHSKYATIFAQAARSIPCLGTTHSDYFCGNIPCVPHPEGTDISESYERNTGRIICEFFKQHGINPVNIQACLVSGHAPFVWGDSIESALENAHVLEIVSEYAYKTLMLNPESSLSKEILDKHFFRKHGGGKYYGQ